MLFLEFDLKCLSSAGLWSSNAPLGGFFFPCLLSLSWTFIFRLFRSDNDSVWLLGKCCGRKDTRILNLIVFISGVWWEIDCFMKFSSFEWVGWMFLMANLSFTSVIIGGGGKNSYSAFCFPSSLYFVGQIIRHKNFTGEIWFNFTCNFFFFIPL